MDTLTAVVLIVHAVLFCGIVFYALYSKGYVKAGATVADSSFFIEVRDRTRLSRSSAAGEK
jgi:hypothetical protein